MPRWACRAAPASPSVPRSRRTRPACLVSRMKGFTTSYTSRPSASRCRRPLTVPACHASRRKTSSSRWPTSAVLLLTSTVRSRSSKATATTPDCRPRSSIRRSTPISRRKFSRYSASAWTAMAPEKLCAGTATPKALPSQKRRTLAPFGNDGKRWAGSPRLPPHQRCPHMNGMPGEGCPCGGRDSDTSGWRILQPIIMRGPRPEMGGPAGPGASEASGRRRASMRDREIG